MKKKAVSSSIYDNQRNLRLSALSTRKTVLVSKDYILEVTKEKDAYEVSVLDPSTQEVELSFSVLKNHEELSYRTLQQHLWLPPRLMEKVLRQARDFGISLEEAYLGEVRSILLDARRTIELLEKPLGGRGR